MSQFVLPVAGLGGPLLPRHLLLCEPACMQPPLQKPLPGHIRPRHEMACTGDQGRNTYRSGVTAPLPL